MTHPVAEKIETAYQQRTARSAAHHQAAQQVLPGGDSRTVTYFGPHPLYIDAGQGQHMTDVDGNSYLDYLGNYTAMIHGHGHPVLTQTIAEQAARGTGYSACAPVQVALAEEICRRILTSTSSQN